ncbi:MAG: hypothetical protein M1829_004707 [Trizodia sp. TS-e1964]|nr:MAG: hypothetical protein M1829_004707 [Trizodia sp. TS-e1964]
MPGTVSDVPTVSLSFANNFWGKDDAGVHPLLERMHNAKVTCDELKAFYNARASIEEEYARKLLSLCRKPLGSAEAGTLRMSLDVMRGEVESMGKAHQSIAGQMKTELEEPLAAFAGAMKERRKIVQNGVEKLFKVKSQQTSVVNKTRDRYEQDCLKIKGYLAQGHMVMGQEERKNKAKMEKTQIQLATSNNEYEAAVKVLEETTGRWNRDWKAACDKFQDLEEERLDFTKSSLWNFANIASTVCVSDDASCEKVRLSLEVCEVEKDISMFIKDKGTGQEIPDPPKYINFCRGDVNDSASEASEEDNYSVAQFQRTINPVFRSSSPAPSTLESHHDPNSALAMKMSHQASQMPQGQENNSTPQKSLQASKSAPALDYQRQPAPQLDYQRQAVLKPDYQMSSGSVSPEYPQLTPQSSPQKQPAQLSYQKLPSSQQIYQNQALAQLDYHQSQRGEYPSVPHNEYPLDGMTMLCRTAPPSERSSATSPVRTPSRDSHSHNSEYSNPTSFSSQEPPAGGKPLPIKLGNSSTTPANREEKQVQKRKSGFFQSHSPFRRKSKHEKENSVQNTLIRPSTQRNTWSSATSRSMDMNKSSQARQAPIYGQERQARITDGNRSSSPEPVDPRASFQLNVGNNVFDVATPDTRNKRMPITLRDPQDDPMAAALAELGGVTKQASVRMSADRYHGIVSPAPPGSTNGSVGATMAQGPVTAAQRGTPPPSYEIPSKRLDLPKPAFTSAQMIQTRQKYTAQTQNMFNAPPPIQDPAAARPGSRQYDGRSQSRPSTRGSATMPAAAVPRAVSPAPPRAISPRPAMYDDQRQQHRSVSPNPYGNGQQQQQQGSSNSTSPIKRGPGHGYSKSYSRQNSPAEARRAVSPLPAFRQSQATRPGSSGMPDMQLQLAPAPEDTADYGSDRGRGSMNNRPMSYYNGGHSASDLGVQPQGPLNGASQRQRSKSMVPARQYAHDGRPVLHYARALYVYSAAIPEELSFAKGDILAVLRLQDDGWWEAEVMNKSGRPGLVPSNYLQVC